jgi:hypothetical protein
MINDVSSTKPTTHSPLLNYAAEERPKAWILLLIIAILFGGAAYLLAEEPATNADHRQYNVSPLPSVGTKSGGNSIND